MKSKSEKPAAGVSQRRLGILACLALGMGLATWVLLTSPVFHRLPEDYPYLPDLQNRNRVLVDLLGSADRKAREKPGSADHTGHLGMAYHANQFFQPAEAAYRIARRLAPADYRWPYLLAVLKEETGEEKEILTLLQQTLQCKADYYPALQKMADICYKQDRMKEAVGLYEQSARYGGKESDLQARTGLGRIAARQKEWQRVVDIVEPLTLEYAYVRTPHQLLLDAYRALGKNDAAEAEADTLLEPTLIVLPLLKDPLVEELNRLTCSSTRLLKEAGLASRFRRPEDAIRWARRAVEVEQGDADAHHFLARVLLEAHGAAPNEVQEALYHLERGLQLRPEDRLPLWYFASFFFRQKKTDEAVRQLQDLLRKQPESAETHYYLGLVADRRGYAQEAMGHYRQALARDPQNAEALHKLGLACISAGNREEGIAWLQRAVQIKPTFTVALCNLGVALDQAGRTAQAIVQFRQALLSKPNDALSHQYLAIALMRVQKIDEATRHFREAIRFDPEEAEAHYGLACALALQNRREESLAEFHRTLQLNPDHPDAARQLSELQKN